MKNIALALMVIALLSTTGYAADMAKQGEWGIQTSLGVASSTILATSSVGFKFMVSHNVAIRAEAGFSTFSPAGGGGSTSGFEFGAGFEYHLTSAPGSVSPYLGLQAGFGGGSVSGGGTTPSLIGANAVFGGEYFFSSNFSAAGEIGVGFSSLTNQPAPTPQDPTATGSSTTFGTRSVIFIVTWYMN
jgi:hypothetical protein